LAIFWLEVPRHREPAETHENLLEGLTEVTDGARTVRFR
jgi:hypothetical protein